MPNDIPNLVGFIIVMSIFGYAGIRMMLKPSFNKDVLKELEANT
jgi:hypothetical protein